jgi:hypothetical protein
MQSRDEEGDPILKTQNSKLFAAAAALGGTQLIARGVIILLAVTVAGSRK